MIFGAAIKRSIANFPFIRCDTRIPGDRHMYRPIMQFKPDGGDRVRWLTWLREVKPEQFEQQMQIIESEQTI